MLIYLIFLLGAFVRCVFGFGEALVTTPLLLLLAYNPQHAMAIIGIIGFVLALPTMFQNYQLIDGHLIWRLLIGAVFGVPIGLLFLKFGNVVLLKKGIGLLLIFYGVINLMPKLVSDREIRLSSVFVGVVSGFLGGAINTHGAPIAIYGRLKNWSPEYLRTNLQTYFGIVGLVIIIGQGLSGLWDATVFWTLLRLIPGLMIVAVFAELTVKYVNPKQLTQYLLYFFIVIGGIMLF
ncbi:sulfite exporter TauE/SafE family protein [Weissella diestrammenae]|nr:sulfite exporter TauE/SafE family protein [Weissella diestrammenae]MCM0582062.1 sulfite exporter TauE/SafE family protein [Weissella diestrammenae]